MRDMSPPVFQATLIPCAERLRSTVRFRPLFGEAKVVDPTPSKVKCVVGAIDLAQKSAPRRMQREKEAEGQICFFFVFVFLGPGQVVFSFVCLVFLGPGQVVFVFFLLGATSWCLEGSR